jgi:glutamate synthase (NADPH/NADH) small chain
MPARHEEIEHAEQEGIRFLFLATPIRLLGDPENNLRRVECLEAEIFVIAIGQGPNPILAQTTPGLEVDKWGRILVDPVTRQSSLPGVFAGGDIIGGATVISAMGDGRAAARAIHEYVSSKTAAIVN